MLATFEPYRPAAQRVDIRKGNCFLGTPSLNEANDNNARIAVRLIEKASEEGFCWSMVIDAPYAQRGKKC